MNMKLAACALLAVVLAATFEQATAQATFEDGMTAYRSENYQKAAEVWRALAEKGDPAAQAQLGALYADGKGVGQNDATALLWFQRAAEQGNVLAQYNVGASYASGLGAPKRDDEAAKWFRRAADQGMPYAQLNLGLLYAAGHGVPQDNVEALKWLELALFALPAGGPRSDVAHAMQDVADKMTPEQLQAVKERVRGWKAKPEGK